MRKEGQVVFFEQQQTFFPFCSAPVIACRAVFVHDAVAGDNQIDGVVAACRSHRAAGLRMTASLCQFLIT